MESNVAQEMQVEIYLLGTFEIKINGQVLQASLSRKTRALLAYLVASPKKYNRETLYNIFCQETDDPAGSLRWHLSRIRRLIHKDLLHVDNQVVGVNTALVTIDSLQFQQVINETDLTNIDFETLLNAVMLYRAEFLSGLNLPDAPEFSIWQLAERTRYTQFYERGLTALVEQLIQQGSYLEAIRWAQILLQNNLLLESAHARLMWLYARINQRENALKQYEQCRDVLQKELAVEPGEEIIQLHQDILSGALTPPTILPERPLTPQLQIPSNTAGRADFIGRDDALDQLGDTWQQALQDGVGVVLVDAEAGGGKTRLITEFTRVLPEHHLLIGQCYESSKNTPYQPWVQLLDTWVQHVPDDTPIQIDPFWYDQLAHLVPSMALRRKRTPAKSATHDFNEVHLFMAVVHLLTYLQANAPIVLFLDDLQWADETSLRLFQFVAGRIRDQQTAPVLMFGAFRSEEAEENPALPTIIHDLSRTEYFTAVSLKPLDSHAIGEFIRTHWNSDQIDPSQHEQRLLDITGGNPLYLTEVLHELSRDEVNFSNGNLPIPQSLNDLVLRRLQRLPENERQVIDALAVISLPISSETVQSVSGRSEDDVFGALDAGLRWRLLRALEDESPTHFAFQHELIRETVMRQINAIRRERLHQRSATKLAEMGAPPAQVAYHWRAAGNSEQEAHYIGLAGEQAADLFSNKDARIYLERAIEITKDPQRQAELLVKLATVLFSLGDWDASEEIAYRALRLAESHDFLGLQGSSLLVLGQIDRNRGYFPEALERHLRAEEIFTHLEDFQQLNRVLGGIGSIYWRQADYDRALEYQTAALKVAIENDDIQGIGAAHGSLGTIYSQMGDLENAGINLEHALKIARQLDQRGRIGKIIGNIGVNYARQGDYEQSWSCFCQQLTTDYELGDLTGVATVLNNLAIICRYQGDFEQALLCTNYALSLNLKMHNLRSIAISLGEIASIYIDQMIYEEAKQFSSQAITLGQTINLRYEVAAFHVQEANRLFGLERYADALKESREALDIAREIQRQDTILHASIFELMALQKLGEITLSEAVQDLSALIDTSTQPADHAYIYYNIWQTDPTNTHAQQQAMQFYEDLYAKDGTYVYYERYTALSGKTLPRNIMALDLPDFVREKSFEIEDIFTQLDRLLDDIAV
ncbi:MAG: tetratricopeptide repeat protein [Aggregatilineales bacterium]